MDKPRQLRWELDNESKKSFWSGDNAFTIFRNLQNVIFKVQ